MGGAALSLEESDAEVGDTEPGEGLWAVGVGRPDAAGAQGPHYHLGTETPGTTQSRSLCSLPLRILEQEAPTCASMT